MTRNRNRIRFKLVVNDLFVQKSAGLSMNRVRQED